MAKKLIVRGVRLDSELGRDLDAYCAAEDLTLSEVIRLALRTYIYSRRDERDAPPDTKNRE